MNNDALRLALNPQETELALSDVELAHRRMNELALARAEIQRYSQREIAFSIAHWESEEQKLPAPLVCPNCGHRESWGPLQSGIDDFMKCNKEMGGCGNSMSLDPADPENLRQARDLARQDLAKALEQSDASLAEIRGILLAVRGEANQERERADRAEAELVRMTAIRDARMQDLAASDERERLLRLEVAACKDELARINGAVLPEALQNIESLHRMASTGWGTNDGVCAHRDRATLLDAVRVLTVERDLQKRRAEDNLAMRAEVDSLHVELADWRDQFDDVGHARRAKDNAVRLVEENDLLRAEIEKLTAERNARIRDVLAVRAKEDALFVENNELRESNRHLAEMAELKTAQQTADVTLIDHLGEENKRLVSERDEALLANVHLAEVAELANASLAKRTAELLAVEAERDGMLQKFTHRHERKIIEHDLRWEERLCTELESARNANRCACCRDDFASFEELAAHLFDCKQHPVAVKLAKLSDGNARYRRALFFQCRTDLPADDAAKAWDELRAWEKENGL